MLEMAGEGWSIVTRIAIVYSVLYYVFCLSVDKNGGILWEEIDTQITYQVVYTAIFVKHVIYFWRLFVFEEISLLRSVENITHFLYVIHKMPGLYIHKHTCKYWKRIKIMGIYKHE